MVTSSAPLIAVNTGPEIIRISRSEVIKNQVCGITDPGGSDMSKTGVEWGGRGVEWGGRGVSLRGVSLRGVSLR